MLGNILTHIGVPHTGNGQHQRWGASSEQCAASEGSGWQQGGSRGAEGWRH